MTNPRSRFRTAYRAARAIVNGHHILAAQEAKRIDREPGLAAAYDAALHCGLRRHEWLFGIQASKEVRAAGRSPSKCIKICLNAVRHRRRNGWKFGKGGYAAWAGRVAA